MDAEQFLQTIPRPVLVLGAIILGVALIMIFSPPHTICDTQTDQVKDSLAGVTQPLKNQKQTLPPRIKQELQNCYQGSTPGACYDYFQTLRGLARYVMAGTSECRSEIYAIKDVHETLEEGVTNMALLAWGDKPPVAGAFGRFGPLQDSELALFCYLKSAIIAGKGEEYWHVLRKKVFTQFPGEEVPLPKDPKDILKPARPATKLMSELDIWNRSLFSVRCENYL
jgi:hypothetical protein